MNINQKSRKKYNKDNLKQLRNELQRPHFSITNSISNTISNTKILNIYIFLINIDIKEIFIIFKNINILKYNSSIDHMSKKNFTEGFDSFLKENVGDRNSKQEEVGIETRTSFIVDRVIFEKIKAIAYWDRLLIKDIMKEVMIDYIGRYENKNGSIKPIPGKT